KCLSDPGTSRQTPGVRACPTIPESGTAPCHSRCPRYVDTLRLYLVEKKMRWRSRITVWSGSSLPVRTSTTVTLSRTSSSFTEGSWACAILGDEGTIHPKASIEKTSRRTGFMDGDCNFFPGEDHIVSSPEHLKDKMRPS